MPPVVTESTENNQTIQKGKKGFAIRSKNFLFHEASIPLSKSTFLFKSDILCYGKLRLHFQRMYGYKDVYVNHFEATSVPHRLMYASSFLPWICF